MEADHRFGPVAGDEAADRGARNLDVGDPKQGRPPAREVEEALESQREIEVAVRVEAALRERVEAGEAPLPQADPGSGIAADDHVGLAGGRRPDIAAVALRADLPGSPDVPQPYLEGGVEAGVGSQVARRQ